MQIVINISEKDYQLMKNGHIPFNVLDVIVNGTPLPKGHGRLIDADELEELFERKCVGDCGACRTKRKTDGKGRWYDTCSLIDSSPTIIEADKGESEDKE